MIFDDFRSGFRWFYEKSGFSGVPEEGLHSFSTFSSRRHGNTPFWDEFPKLTCFKLPLAGNGGFHKDARLMGDQLPPNSSMWPMEKVLPMFSHPLRWKILLTLAERGPLPASALPGGAGRGLDGVLKQLITLRNAGMVQKLENPADRRISLYAVSPNLPIVKTAEGAEVRFAYCVFYLKARQLGLAPKV